MNNENRKCGVILHPTSFPSPYEIGDFGKEARDFLTTLAECKVKLWQILPLGPTGYGDSPYSSLSCFAGNEYLIDLRSIDGFVPPIDECGFNSCVDYEKVYSYKMPLLKKAASVFYSLHSKDPEFVSFLKENDWWLEDYALFRAIAGVLNDTRWYVWPDDIKNRESKAIKEYSTKLSDEILIFKTLQYLFYTQWQSLHEFANNLGIEIIGDIPIFAARDSSDVWSNTNLFKMDSQTGVPPDAFSATGQLWGSPTYNWKEHKKDEYSWWRKRLEFTLSLVDIVRIDHFRGFESFWESAVDAKTAMDGKWVKGPAMDILKYFEGKKIIAEDLGCDLEKTRELLKKTSWPGMKVAQFGFDVNDGYLNSSQEHLPHNYEENVVGYTGTHDNETTRGWYNNQSDLHKDFIRRYLQCSDDDVVWQMIRSVIISKALYAIFPMQDVIGLDNSARMNAPSTVGKFNWSWRYNPAQFKDWMKFRLKDFILLYGRC